MSAREGSRPSLSAPSPDEPAAATGETPHGVSRHRSALMAEQADAHGSNPCARHGRPGSTPGEGTSSPAGHRPRGGGKFPRGTAREINDANSNGAAVAGAIGALSTDCNRATRYELVPFGSFV